MHRRQVLLALLGLFSNIATPEAFYSSVVTSRHTTGTKVHFPSTNSRRTRLKSGAFPVISSLRASRELDSDESLHGDPSRRFDVGKKKQRHAWLQRTTHALLETEPGSLVKGKWHELMSMMTAWSKLVKDDPAAPVLLEKLLKRIIDERRAGNGECRTTTHLYNLVLEAWATSAIQRGEGAARRALEILQGMQQTFEADQDPDTMPHFLSFFTVLTALCKTEDATMAKEMLHWMEQLHHSGRNSEARPILPAFVTVLDAYANSQKDDAGEQAEDLLRHMNVTGVAPNTLCYNIAIKAWVKSKRGRQSAEHAERILDEMLAEPDVITYSSVINAWASSGMKAHAAERAEQILRKIENHGTIKPNIVTYNTCLNAWCKSNSPLTVNRTEALLERMEASEHVSPDIVTYNTYLHALSMNGKEPGMAQRAEDILCRLEQRFDSGEIDFGPNLFSYNLVIEGWRRSRVSDAATKACDVLRKLVKRDGVEPDAISYNQVISALSRSSMPGAALKAERLLQYMEDSCKSGVSTVQPDVVGYSSAITAWARSGEAGCAERAERLLNHMEERYAAGEKHLKPNVIAYNAVIDAWARSGEGTLGARKAEALLQRMQALYDAGDTKMQPNLITYNAVLNAWAKSGTRCCAYKAESYLDRMWELYQAGNKRVKPDGKSYNTVINAISKSKNEGKAQKALRILRRMDKLYRAGDMDTRPNELTYTAVLNSCAFPAVFDPKSRRKALDTAIFTLGELQQSQYGRPNHVTYGTFLKACANLMPMDDKLRRMVIAPVFLQCCRDGQVGRMVLSHLRVAAPADLYQELLGGVVSSGATVRLEDLPLEWRCNVQEGTRWGERTRTSIRSPGKQHKKQKPGRLNE